MEEERKEQRTMEKRKFVDSLVNQGTKMNHKHGKCRTIGK